MPEVSRFYGMVIKMYFRDHNPPHFHVEYQDYMTKTDIKTGVVEGKMPNTDLKLVLK